MTNLIILEGIPTAGKSQTLNCLLKDLFELGKICVFIDDSDIIDILRQRKNITDKRPVENVQDYLINILNSKLSNKLKPDFILVHNFHFFFGALNNSRGKNESIENNYSKLERFISENFEKSLTVFLRINKDFICKRFLDTIKVRESNGETNIGYFWHRDYGNDDSKKIEYQENKQESFQRFFNESNLKKLTFKIDKIDLNIYPQIAEVILKEFKLNS